MRILVTGSRDWQNERTIWTALDNLSVPGDTLVHGDCPTGADQMAHRWAESRGVNIKKYPADWKNKGPAAGPIRNLHMVTLGADICLAFIGPGSKGAVGCAKMAEDAGIPTKRFYDSY